MKYLAALVLLWLLLASATVNAQIQNWKTGEIIPGTENINPGPGIDLSLWDGYLHSKLDYADLSGGLDLHGSTFNASHLNNSRFSNANINNCLFMNSLLEKADFSQADLANSVFSNASVNGAQFTLAKNFTKEQLYSTASYKEKNLSSIGLGDIDISYADMTEQNLTHSYLMFANMTMTDFSRADMRRSDYVSGIDSAIFKNTILENGHINGLNLSSGNTLPIRDFDGNVEITIDNIMLLSSDANINIIIEDAAWGSKISLSDDIPVVLDGILNLSVAPEIDIEALVGTTFNLFDWNGQLTSNDAFNEIKTDIPANYTWLLEDLYSTGQVTLVPEPASALLWLVGLTLLRKTRS